MKNIKKILSALIVLSMLLSSFSALAFEVNLNADSIIDDIFKFDIADFLASGKDDGETGEDGVVTVDPDVERINFLGALGIWDDTTKSKDALVTMTEFSVIMSKFKLGAQNALIDIYTKNEDNNNVTFKQAYEYMLEALGYYYKCAQYGDGDRASLIVASEIRLLSSNPENINTYITRNELAKLIARGLTIDLSVIEYGDTGYTYTVVPGKNILNTVHGIHELNGFVNAIPGLAVYGSETTRTNFIQIERTEVFTGEMDLRDYFAKAVDAYVKYDPLTNQNNLVYICLADNHKEKVINFKNLISVDPYEIKYINEEEKEEILNISTLKYVLKNGNKLESIADMGSFTENEGEIVLTSTVDGKIDTALIYSYQYFVSMYTDLNKTRIGLKFDQKCADQYGVDQVYVQIDDKKVNDIYLDGVPSTWDKITTNVAFRIFRSDAGYTRIDASTLKIDKPAEELYDDTVVIEGKEYTLTRDVKRHIERSKTDLTMANLDKIPEITLGTPASFYIVGDMIVAYTMNTNYKWGYLVSATIGRSTLDDSMSLKIFSDEGMMVTLPLADKVELDAVKGYTRLEVRERILHKDNYPVVFDELIRFKVNADDEIIALDTALVSVSEISTTDDVNMLMEYYGRLDWTKWYLPDTIYFVDKTTKIFVIPDDRNKTDQYQVISSAALPYNSQNSEGNFRFTLYNPDDYLHLGAMVYYGEISQGSGNSYWLHVESVKRMIIDPDTFKYGYKLSGKSYVGQADGRGQTVDAYLIVPDDMYEAKPIGVGDFIFAKYGMGFIATDYFISWVGGVVPDTDLKSGQGANPSQRTRVGDIIKIDYARQYVIIDIDGEPFLFLPRAKAIINPNTDKTIPATISDFHVGDRVCTTVQSGHGQFIFKNEY